MCVPAPGGCRREPVSRPFWLLEAPTFLAGGPGLHLDGQQRGWEGRGCGTDLGGVFTGEPASPSPKGRGRPRVAQ